MFSTFGLLDFGMPELLIILAIVLLLFGGKKLPELSKSLGESMKEIRKGLSSDHASSKTSEPTSSDKPA
jgi:sec-independent protein translocase protein TatA